MFVGRRPVAVQFRKLQHGAAGDLGHDFRRVPQQRADLSGRSARADEYGAGKHRDLRVCRSWRCTSGPSRCIQELQTSQMNLRQLAEETGGVAAVGTNDMNKAFDRIVQENSSYYVLGYYSDQREARRQAAQDQRESERVSRRAGDVSASATRRRAGSAEEHGAASRWIPRPGHRRADGDDCEPLPKTGLPLRITAMPHKGAGKTTDVEMLIETAGKELTFKQNDGTFNDKLSLLIGIFDKDGKSVAAERPDVDLNLRPETHARVVAERRQAGAPPVGAARPLSASRGGAGQREDEAGQRPPRSRRARLHEGPDWR